MSANQHQVGGNHYAKKAIQPWDYIVGNNLGYLEGNIIKYVSRYKDKGGPDDLDKAIHYLQKLREVVSPQEPVICEPVLHANYETGEGRVSVPNGWEEMDAILRADLLRDWLYDMEKLYKQATKEIFPQGEKSE